MPQGTADVPWIKQWRRAAGERLESILFWPVHNRICSHSGNVGHLCHAGYIAGFVDLEVSNRSDLYDVFVNLADREITIAPLAKG